MTDQLTTTEARTIFIETRQLVHQTIPECVGRIALTPSHLTRLYTGGSVYRMRDIVAKLTPVLVGAGNLEAETAKMWNEECQRMTNAAAALAGVPVGNLSAHAELMETAEIIENMK